MNIKVIGARAVVKLDEIETKTLGGIIIPGAEKEVVTRGEIVAVGEGMRNSSGNLIPMEVSVGDKVIFGQTAGAPIEIEGKEGQFLVINEREILAIVE